MLLPEHDRGRPGEKAASNVIAAGSDTHSLATSTLHHPKAIAPAWAILVQRRNGNWTRQIFLSLHSATRAMERAEANGIEARCQLVEIVPVPALPVIVVGSGDVE